NSYTPFEETTMKAQRTLAALTVINLALLACQLLRFQPAAIAQAKPAVRPNEVAEVLRGKSLEIVDDRGRVRASIKIQTPDGKRYTKANGKPYPETVMFRLVDPNGKPNVKLGASVDGAGLGLGGESDPTYIQIIADGPETVLNLTNHDGKKQTIK